MGGEARDGWVRSETMRCTGGDVMGGEVEIFRLNTAADNG